MNDQQNRTILSFKLGRELFGVDVANVLEVLKNEGITSIPRSEQFVKGIVNFRGNIITVIDFMEKMNLPIKEKSREKVIIIFTVKNDDRDFVVGVLADNVRSVMELKAHEVRPLKEISHYYNPEYLEGVVKENDDFIIVLNFDKVFSAKEIRLIQKTEENNKKQ